jgi:hypothetical protein
VGRFPLGQSRLCTAEAGTELPEGFALSQNYPNPFNPSTEIAFCLPGAERVTFEVFNALGQRSATLIDEEFSAGRHSLRFDAAHFPSGVYFYRMQAGGFLPSQKDAAAEVTQPSPLQLQEGACV